MNTDSTITPPRQPWSKKLAPLGMMLVPTLLGAGAGYLLGGSAVQLPWLRSRFEALAGWDLLMLPLLILFVLAVHELGHLYGGIRRGMRFLLLIVGPLQWSRTAEGVRFNWVFNLGTLGGLAAATPDLDRPLAPQLRALILGVPLASLLLAFLGVALGLGLESRLGAYALVVGAISALIFLVTALPLRAGGFMSDGMQYLELRRGGQAVVQRQQLIQLMAASYAGARPRDWDASLIEQVLAMEHGDITRRIAGRLFALLHAIDRADERAADEHAAWLHAHAEAYPDGFRQALRIELCMHALRRRDLATARAQWAASRGGVVDPARRALCEAQLAYEEGDATRAMRSLAMARRQLRHAADAGTSQLTMMQIVTLEHASQTASMPAAAR